MTLIAELDIDMAPLMRALNKLPGRVQKKVIGGAATFGMTPAVKAARAIIQNDTGLSAKALGKKRKNHGANNISSSMIVRPSVLGVRRDGRAHHPSKIAHILAGGFDHTSGRRIEGSDFAAQAMETRETEIISRAVSKLAQGIERETEKLKSAS